MQCVRTHSSTCYYHYPQETVHVFTLIDVVYVECRKTLQDYYTQRQYLYNTKLCYVNQRLYTFSNIVTDGQLYK